MTNLLQETITKIRYSRHTPNDITFIGSTLNGHCCTWDEFCTLANVEYIDNCGGSDVATNLVIVFNDGTWLSRVEYNDCEYWELNHPCPTLAELNEG